MVLMLILFYLEMKIIIITLKQEFNLGIFSSFGGLVTSFIVQYNELEWEKVK